MKRCAKIVGNSDAGRLLAPRTATGIDIELRDYLVKVGAWLTAARRRPCSGSRAAGVRRW